MKLNRRAFEHATRLVREGRVVIDEREAWSDHRPTADAENDLILRGGWDEFARWHLGLNTSAAELTKARHRFLYGDLVNVHLCAVLAAERAARQNHYREMVKAMVQLHELIETHAVRR